MLVYIIYKDGGFPPVIVSPAFKILSFVVAVALIIHIVQKLLVDHKIGREVVNIQTCLLCLPGHIPYLVEVFRLHSITLDQPVNGRTGDIGFQDPLFFQVDIQHFRNADPSLLEAAVVVALRFDLIAKSVITTGLMMNLLQHIFGAVALNQIGIAAFTAAQ